MPDAKEEERGKLEAYWGEHGVPDDYAEMLRLCKEFGIGQSSYRRYKEKYQTKNRGDFNLQEYLRGELPSIAKQLIKQVESGKSPRSIELALKALGELVEKQEQTVKHEFTTTERISVAREFVNELREEANKGRCPICGEHKALRIQPRVDTEPEHDEDREVEVMGLPS